MPTCIKIFLRNFLIRNFRSFENFPVFWKFWNHYTINQLRIIQDIFSLKPRIECNVVHTPSVIVSVRGTCFLNILVCPRESPWYNNQFALLTGFGVTSSIILSLMLREAKNLYGCHLPKYTLINNIIDKWTEIKSKTGNVHETRRLNTWYNYINFNQYPTVSFIDTKLNMESYPNRIYTFEQ